MDGCLGDDLAGALCPGTTGGRLSDHELQGGAGVLMGLIYIYTYMYVSLQFVYDTVYINI